MNSKTTLKEKNANNYLTHTMKNNGITLIALVITIIIMLILAGVAISSLIGKESIIEYSESAVGKYNNSIIREDQIIAEIMNEIRSDNTGNGNSGGTGDSGNNEGTGDEGNDFIDETGCLASDYQYVSTSNSALKITIPQGFALMNSAGTSKLTTEAEYQALLTDANINNGIVVQAKDGSEFVWVPITNTEATGDNNMYWVSDGANVGQLYSNNSGNVFGTKRTQYSTSGGLSEPSVVSGDATEKNTITSGDSDALLAQFQSEFNAMINSVKTYGGFYVGRYETSFQNGKVKSAKTTDPTQILNAGRDDCLYWYGLYEKAKSYVTDAGISNATSCMIWGCAYDQIMLWMQDTITVTDTSGTIGNFSSNPINTGSVNNYCIKNIYDLCGNYQEWTMDCLWSGRAARGGNYTSSTDYKSISSRENRPGTEGQAEITTRIQLFINV